MVRDGSVKGLRILRGVVCLALLVGCAGTIEYRTNDWEAYDGPGAAAFQQQEISLFVANDPLEPTNRRTWAFNSGFVNVVRPLAAGYRFIVPEFARTALGNFFHNLLYPVRLVNNLVQGQGGAAWDETRRFAVNTTIGVLGFLDAAGADISRAERDSGQSLGKAGWDEPSFLVLPFVGPSTTRDAVGWVGDALLDPATWYSPASLVSRWNTLSDELDEFRRLEASTYDLYHLAQFLTELTRSVAVEDVVHRKDTCVHCVAKETIQAIFLTYHDENFPDLARQCTAPLPGSGRSIPYTLFLQPKPAPMVFILPGLGGHRLENSSYALAEMVYRHGLSAVTLSSSMNFEFIAKASSVEVPGFAPVDAHDVHLAVDAIHTDVEASAPGRVTAHVLMGISLGAFHALYIAADEDNPDVSLERFETYVAINPPVRFERGVSQLDAYYNAPLQLPPELRDSAIQHTFRKALKLTGGTLRPESMLPFNELESQFLIGLAFRQTLQNVIFQTQLRHNMGVLRTELDPSDRSPAYREISEYSFREYFYAFVLPCFANLRDDIHDDEAGVQRLFELCDLHSLEDRLASNERIHLITNVDDFLLEPTDLAWLSATFGAERCQHFEFGGHLGNLYRPEVQDQVMAAVLSALHQVGQGPAEESAVRP